MTREYQMPLFSDLSLSSLIAERVEKLPSLLEKLYPSCRGKKLLDNVVMCSRLYPLELLLEQQSTEVDLAYVNEVSGENVYCYTRSVPFRGDAFLWFLNTGLSFAVRRDGDPDFPIGEVFRQELIMVVYAKNEIIAQAELHERLARIKAILSSQKKAIDKFNLNLPSAIMAIVDASGYSANVAR